MSEIRQDPHTGRYVIIGGERAGRPNEFLEATSRPRDLPCPFCAGHEEETPPPIAAFGASQKRPWLVRVVPNKYPAVHDGDAAREGGGRLGGSLALPGGGSLALPGGGSHDLPGGGSHTLPQDPSQFAPPGLPAFGRHEVIIESPDHIASVSELTDCELDAVFTAYHARISELSQCGDFRYVQVFKNVGPAAGASLEHLHSQLMALPTVPDVIEQELTASARYFKEHRRPLLVELIDSELAARQRLVAETKNFVAFCPFASRFGYEVLIAPRRHQPAFEAAQPGELGELSRLVRDVIGRIECAVGPVAYNYFLHTRPFDMPAYDHYHWHIEIIPRLTKVAGFEWSTGCFINPYPPEAAAAHLRSTSPVFGRRKTS